MPALIYDPLPVELEALLERRRELDQDRRDEVWEGVLHMIPPASFEHERLIAQLIGVFAAPAKAAGLVLAGAVGIGEEDDYRVPDVTLVRPPAEKVWQPTAALVVEVLSPYDRARTKLDFYAAHGVDELLIVDPERHTVEWLALSQRRYEPTERSGLIDLGPAALAARLDWSAG